MNWFKKAQQIISYPTIGKDPSYLDIGHSDDPRCFSKNIIWTITEGQLKIQSETPDTPTHREAFPFIDAWNDWCGRYDVETNYLSIAIPYKNTIARMRREIPNPILNKLLSAFPNTSKVYVF